MRNLIILLQITVVVIWTIFWINERPSTLDFEDYLIIVLPYFIVLPTLFYLFTIETSKDNLLSLWLKVRKKKLKDELEK